MAFTGLRKCASSPSLSTSEGSQQLEIYCGKRPLVELSQKVPARWHGMMQDIGVSHYYVVVRSESGELTQWDFGPLGGDSTLGRKAEATAAGLLRNPFMKEGKGQRQPAEIREVKLTELPPKHMFVGKTHLTVKDIRSFNSLQRMDYELHRNDCRHYVDRICRYTTGIDAATALCKRHAYRLSRQQAPWSDSFMTVAHMLTDVANWPHIRAATQMSLAFAGAMASKATLSRLPPQLLPQAAPLSLAAPASRAAVQRTLQRKPVALATAMAASYTAGRTPMVQDVGSGVRSIAVNLIASTAFMGQSAARGLASGANQVLAAAGNTLAGASAAVGTCSAAPKLRPRVTLPQLGFPGRRRAVLAAN